MLRQGHPGPPTWPAQPGLTDQHLHPQPVAAVGLQQHRELLVVDRLPGHRPADVLGDVVVPEAHRVGVAQGPRTHLRRGPFPFPGKRPQPPVRSSTGTSSSRSSAGAHPHRTEPRAPGTGSGRRPSAARPRTGRSGAARRSASSFSAPVGRPPGPGPARRTSAPGGGRRRTPPSRSPSAPGRRAPARPSPAASGAPASAGGAARPRRGRGARGSKPLGSSSAPSSVGSPSRTHSAPGPHRGRGHLATPVLARRDRVTGPSGVRHPFQRVPSASVPYVGSPGPLRREPEHLSGPGRASRVATSSSRFPGHPFCLAAPHLGQPYDVPMLLHRRRQGLLVPGSRTSSRTAKSSGHSSPTCSPRPGRPGRSWTSSRPTWPGAPEAAADRAWLGGVWRRSLTQPSSRALLFTVAEVDRLPWSGSAAPPGSGSAQPCVLGWWRSCSAWVIRRRAGVPPGPLRVREPSPGGEGPGAARGRREGVGCARRRGAPGGEVHPVVG